MDKNSPETGKIDYFDSMPDPYKNQLGFEAWFSELLTQVFKPPKGYEDKRREDGSKYSTDELTEFFRQQLRSDIAYWTSEKPHPRDPNRIIPGTSSEVIRQTLKDATEGMIKPLSKR